MNTGRGQAASARTAALGLAASLILIWPALLNGQALFFWDTADYLRTADRAVQALTGLRSDWSGPPVPAPSAASDLTTPPAPGGNENPDAAPAEPGHVPLLGRSIYYGAMLYLGQAGSTFWLAAWIQAAVLVAMLMLCLRQCGVNSWPADATLIAVAAVSPAAWFASYLMPDLLAGLTILCAALLLARREPISRGGALVWLALLGFATLAHITNLLLCAGLLVTGALLRASGWIRPPALSLLVLAAAVALGVLGDVVFATALKQRTEQLPVRPPFLTARTIADGPGADYLRARCPEAGFAVCDYVDRLPLTVGEFLWSSDPDRGVFIPASPAGRAALAAEQYRFALAVLRHDPLGQIRASLRNVAIQLESTGVRSLDYAPDSRDGLIETLAPRSGQIARASAAYQGRLPVEWASRSSLVLSLLACLYLAVAGLSPGRQGGDQALRIAGLCVIGILGNALICAALSAPAERYQARVIWLLPIVATVLALVRSRHYKTPAA